MRLDAEELLDELGWLRQLARGLVGPVGVEEDLVQATWLAAARVEGGVSRAWLVGTLRKLAARWHRTESRLHRREVAVARPEAVDTDSLIERNELFGRVVEELRKLDEPFRTTLFLVYQEGLSTEEAATRLGVPIDTLRWRRREGLTRLRARLDRNARAGSDWRAALLPVLALPSMDLAGGASASSTAASTLTHVGGFWMTWKLTSAVIVAGLALVYVLAGMRDEGGLELREAQVQESLEVAEAPTAPVPVPAPVKQEPQGESRAVVPTPQTQATEVPTWEGPTLVVEVIDRRRAPVVGARVWAGGSPDPVDVAWISDEQGFARMPMPEEVTLISGATERLYGRTPIIPQVTGGELVLWLAPDADVQVEVVDQAGSAVAGVPVGIVGRSHNHNHVIFSGVVSTDSEGLAVLRHVPSELVFARDKFVFDVGPAVLLSTRSDITLNLSNLPGEPARITLPPTGSLLVRVLNSAGTPHLTAKQVRVGIDPFGGSERRAPQLLESLRFPPLGRLNVELTDGVGEVPFIGLGLDLAAYAEEADPTDTTLGSAAGPRTTGSKSELTLRALEVSIELVGIAQSTDGRPLERRQLTGQVKLRGALMRDGFSAEVTTDPQGRFAIAVDERVLRAWGDATEKRSLALFAANSGPLDLVQAEVSLPAQLDHGRNDVGTLQLHPITPLVAGRAVDTRGEALMLESVEMRIGSRSDPGHYRGLFESREVTEGAAFAVFGTPPELDAGLDEVLSIWGHVQGRPSTRAMAMPGEEGVVLVFEQGGYLRGSVLTDPSDSPRSYLLKFMVTEPSGVRMHEGLGQFASNGRFEVDSLPLVLGDLEIYDPETGATVATVRAVLPLTSSEAQDERLAQIDMRFSLNEFTLSVVDEEGVAIETVSFSSPTLRNPRESYGYGWFLFRSEDASIEGELHAPGYRSADVSLNPGDQTVVLYTGPTVSVRPEPLIDLPHGVEVVLLLAAIDRAEVVELEANPDGSYSGHVSSPGEYLVRGRLQRNGVTFAELPLSSDSTVRVIITDQVAEQEFTANFDREAFEAHIP